jgi:hypothetical protein
MKTPRVTPCLIRPLRAAGFTSSPFSGNGGLSKAASCDCVTSSARAVRDNASGAAAAPIAPKKSRLRILLFPLAWIATGNQNIVQAEIRF